MTETRLAPSPAAPHRAAAARAGSADRRRDALLALVIFAATALYLSWLPRNLTAADESIHLYEAVRILQGQVLYRDVFEMITPGFMYLMAVLFRLFGADFATARIAQSVLHGIAAVVLFYACRKLGVRRTLAWPAALAYVVVSQPAWPMVSQHWLATLLCIVLLSVCIDLRRDRAAATLAPGLVLGLLISVQQPRGVIMAAGVFLWILADDLLQRRFRTVPVPAPLPARLAWLVGGAALVVVPVLLIAVALAGFQPVWRALVIFPLFDYRGSTHCPWGDVNIVSAVQARYTFPALLRHLPWILPLASARLLWMVVRRQGAVQASRLALLLMLCLFSVMSITYFPDFIHIAFIAPIFYAAIAEGAEWAAAGLLAAVPTPAARRALRGAGWAMAALLLIAGAYQLGRNATRLAAAFPELRRTAFGEIALDPTQAELYDRVTVLMDTVPSRELYSYPIISHLYLMTGSHNPTPYGFMVPGYSGPDLIQHAVDILAARKLPYIVALYLGPEDPIAAYIRDHYEPLGPPPGVEQYIYRRKPGV